MTTTRVQILAWAYLKVVLSRLHLITFGDRLAHLAYLVAVKHQSSSSSVILGHDLGAFLPCNQAKQISQSHIQF